MTTPTATEYRASFTEIDITPDLQSGVDIQGFSLRDRTAHEALTPLSLQLLLLEDSNYTRVLIVAADIFGFDSQVVRAVRAAAEPWGIPPEGILLNASHTHYAPGTVSTVSPMIGTIEVEFVQNVFQEISLAIEPLYRNLSPATLSRGYTTAQIGIRRQQESDSAQLVADTDGYYHESTPFLVVKRPENNHRLIVASHGCHPTGLGRHDHISADYPGFLRNILIDEGTADDVMFLQGAAGTAKQTVGTNGSVEMATKPADIIQNARILADRISDAAEKPLEAVSGNLFAHIENVVLPLQQAKRQEIAATSDSGVSPSSDDRNDDPIQAVEMEVQMIGIGEETAFLTFPAEPPAELARNLIQRTDLSDGSFILGYTNGLQSYLPTAGMIAAGGYEVEGGQQVYGLPTPFAPSIEHRIRGTVARQVEAWQDNDRTVDYGRHHLADTTQESFFCLSTGRCGTQTLANVLDTATNAKVHHHPRPYLIEETLAAYHGHVDEIETFKDARGALARQAWARDLIFGETDHNMTPFAPALAEELPYSKFVVLIRNPWGFVRSGMRRGYYQADNRWERSRLRPEPDHPDAERWHEWSAFQKTCWLWADTYRRIHSYLEEIPDERYEIVLFEDLIDGPAATERLFQFLDLNGYNEDGVRDILNQKMNSQKQGSFPRPEYWTIHQHRELWDICENTVEQFDLASYGQMAENFLAESAEKNQNGEPQTEVQQKIAATTIYDYRKFRHETYPASFSPRIFRADASENLCIDRATPITSMGSCFARNVATYLQNRDYNYLVTEQPFQQASAHWDQVFNTACMRQIFEYTFQSDWEPVVRWWPKDEKVQDPYRRDILYPADRADAAFEAHRAASREALMEAEVIILTLGLIETWRDKRDQMTYYRVPSPRIYDPEIHEFHVQTVEECMRDLNTIHRLIGEHNPDAQLVLTVSPVPLAATFRQEVDVVTANMLSKSTLRVAADYLNQQHDNVHYFPSYEVVREALPNPYEPDNRHVTDETIGSVMETFQRFYVR